MTLVLAVGRVSDIQVAREAGSARPTTYFRIDGAPVRMRRPGHLPVSEKDSVTACGLRKRDYFLALALYNHTTGVHETMPRGRQTAGIIVLFLAGLWLVVQDSLAVKAMGVVIWAGAAWAVWYLHRSIRAARMVADRVSASRP